MNRDDQRRGVELLSDSILRLSVTAADYAWRKGVTQVEALQWYRQQVAGEPASESTVEPVDQAIAIEQLDQSLDDDPGIGLCL